MNDRRVAFAAQAVADAKSGKRQRVLPVLWLTVEETATVLCLSKSKVNLLLKAGVIPSTKFEGRRLVKLADLEELVESQPYTLPGDDELPPSQEAA